jgi:hypothetical protein
MEGWGIITGHANCKSLPEYLSQELRNARGSTVEKVPVL